MLSLPHSWGTVMYQVCFETDMKEKNVKTQVVCPVCGYLMPLFFDEQAESKGIFVTCKGRGCKAVFEVIVKKGEQIR